MTYPWLGMKFCARGLVEIGGVSVASRIGRLGIVVRTGLASDCHEDPVGLLSSRRYTHIVRLRQNRGQSRTSRSSMTPVAVT